MSFAMAEDEREAFLAGMHVGVISIAREGRAPLTVPIWYAYTPGGEVAIVTGKGARKTAFIERAGSFSLCVQDEAPPYKYVTVEGPVVAIEPADRERDTRQMARRYLGVAGGDDFMASTAASAGSTPSADVVIRMRPARWLTADFGKVGD